MLDACCGSRMFWFDRNNKDTVFMDNRELEDVLCDGRKLVIKPDIVADFRNNPFPDNTFYLVVFDPPHLIHAVKNSLVGIYENGGIMMNKQEIEKAIECLNENYVPIEFYPEFKKICLDALTQQLNNGWIPVSEKLPPLGACVICTVREHFRNQNELRYPVYYLQKTYENGYAFYFGDITNPLLPDISEVVAWMPLPDPYKDI